MDRKGYSTVLKFFKCPTKQKSALFIPFCLCICILGVSFGEISDEAFLEHHFRDHVSWHETLCSQKVNTIDHLDTSPGGCFGIQWQKGCSISISNTAKQFKSGISLFLIIKNRPLQIFLSYFLESMKNSYFHQNVTLYKNLEKHDIRFQLFMVILSQMCLGGNMALLDYSNKETLLII